MCLPCLSVEVIIVIISSSSCRKCVVVVRPVDCESAITRLLVHVYRVEFLAELIILCKVCDSNRATRPRKSLFEVLAANLSPCICIHSILVTSSQLISCNRITDGCFGSALTEFC